MHGRKSAGHRSAGQRVTGHDSQRQREASIRDVDIFQMVWICGEKSIGVAEKTGEFAQSATGAVGGLDPAQIEPENCLGMAFEAECSGGSPVVPGRSGRFFAARVFQGDAEPT